MLLAAGFDIVLGAAIAFLLLRTSVPGRNLLDAIATLPLAIPGVVLGVGYLRVFHGWDFPGADGPLTSSWFILVIAYTMRRLPYTVRACYAALQQVHISLEESAQNLGANRLRTFTKITLAADLRRVDRRRAYRFRDVVRGIVVDDHSRAAHRARTDCLRNLPLHAKPPGPRRRRRTWRCRDLARFARHLPNASDIRRPLRQRLPHLAMKPAEVRLEKISKSYGDQWVVRDVSLRIREGEFFTFLGPSGCGKTTLLRMIAGFVEPDEGSIYLDDQPVNQVPPWRRDVGMVFQNYALWPHMTVFENVAFGLRERKVPRGEVKTRVANALHQVDLKGTEGRRPSQLSGGQQQRVALARTLVIQPRVLLLDEPLSNLDAKLRVEMRLELLKLQHEIGLTTIYVTHDQEEALAMSNRIAVILQGKVIQEGAPRDIYEQPADDFIAGFVGQSNLIAGKILNITKEQIVVELADRSRLDICRPASFDAAQAGDCVLLSLRPEAIELTAKDFRLEGSNRIEGKILASAYQGASIEYEITALGRTLKARITNPKGKHQFQRNDEVNITFSADDIMIVPATNPKTISTD